MKHILKPIPKKTIDTYQSVIEMNKDTKTKDQDSANEKNKIDLSDEKKTSVRLGENIAKGLGRTLLEEAHETLPDAKDVSASLGENFGRNFARGTLDAAVQYIEEMNSVAKTALFVGVPYLLLAILTTNACYMLYKFIFRLKNLLK